VTHLTVGKDAGIVALETVVNEFMCNLHGLRINMECQQRGAEEASAKEGNHKLPVHSHQ
jgi:hypothetical protein